MLRSDLCDDSCTYIVFKGTITVNGNVNAAGFVWKIILNHCAQKQTRP